MSNKTARFDTRWTIEEKEYFEYVASLAGFSSLSDFVLFALNEQAVILVEKHNKILATEKDRQLFFDTIQNPSEPNKALTEAYNKSKDLFNP